MARRFATLLILMAALAMSGCSAVGVATTAVGVGVGAATTGVRVGVGTTMRAADLIIHDGETCEERDEADRDASEDADDCAEAD